MGDDVVELAGDPRPLGGRRDLSLLIALTLEAPGPLLERRQVLAPHPGVAAERGGGDDHSAEEDEGEDGVMSGPPQGGEKHAELEDRPGGDRAPPRFPQGDRVQGDQQRGVGHHRARGQPLGEGAGREHQEDGAGSPPSPEQGQRQGRCPHPLDRHDGRARGDVGDGEEQQPADQHEVDDPRMAVEDIAGFERRVHLPNPHTSRRFICQAAAARVATA